MSLTEHAIRTACDSRIENRYPCVGIPLLYSRDTNSTHLSRYFRSHLKNISLLGLAFDVTQQMASAEKIRVYVDVSNKKASDSFLADIRWCRKINEKLFRIGVSLDLTSIIKEEGYRQNNVNAASAIQSRTAEALDIPQEVDAVCPACRRMSSFQYLGCQPVLGGQGVMPLYDCGLCHSTRSLQGILSPF